MKLRRIPVFLLEVIGNYSFLSTFCYTRGVVLSLFGPASVAVGLFAASIRLLLIQSRKDSGEIRGANSKCISKLSTFSCASELTVENVQQEKPVMKISDHVLRSKRNAERISSGGGLLADSKGFGFFEVVSHSFTYQ